MLGEELSESEYKMFPREVTGFSSRGSMEITFNLNKVLSYVKEKDGVALEGFADLGYTEQESEVMHIMLTLNYILLEDPEDNESSWRDGRRIFGISNYGKWLLEKGCDYDVIMKYKDMTAASGVDLEFMEKTMARTIKFIQKSDPKYKVATEKTSQEP